MTLGVSDLQSDSDLDSIRNSCDVFVHVMEDPEYHLHHGHIAGRAFYSSLPEEDY